MRVRSPYLPFVEGEALGACAAGGGDASPWDAIRFEDLKQGGRIGARLWVRPSLKRY